MCVCARARVSVCVRFCVCVCVCVFVCGVAVLGVACAKGRPHADRPPHCWRSPTGISLLRLLLLLLQVPPSYAVAPRLHLLLHRLYLSSEGGREEE